MIIIYKQNGFQPLHMAASNGHIDIAEYLLLECQVPIDTTSQVASYISYIYTYTCIWVYIIMYICKYMCVHVYNYIY